MLTRQGLLSPASRSLMAAMVGVLLLTIPEPPMAVAGPLAAVPDGVSATSDATDFSAARRRRVYRRGGNAAAAAFFGMAIGTIGAIVAQQQREEYYRNYGYYGPGYYNYGYGPGYYGGAPYYHGYYGRRYYRRY